LTTKTDDIHLVTVTECHRRWRHSFTDRSCAVPRKHNTFWWPTGALLPQGHVFGTASQYTYLHDEDISYNCFWRELKSTGF